MSAAAVCIVCFLMVGWSQHLAFCIF